MKPLKGLRGLPKARWDEEDTCPCPDRPHPAWGILEAVAGGLATGLAPLMGRVLVMKLFPELMDLDDEPVDLDDEEEEGKEDDEA